MFVRAQAHIPGERTHDGEYNNNDTIFYNIIYDHYSIPLYACWPEAHVSRFRKKNNKVQIRFAMCDD